MLMVFCVKMSKSMLRVLVVSIVLVQNIKASSLDEIKQKYKSLIMECATEHTITAEDAEILKNKMMPDNENVKCFFACVYKKTGMMNDQGELSVEGVHAMSNKYLLENPEEATKSEEFAKACISVNTEPVNDDPKGCERAVMIYECSLKKLPEFGFSL